ncbi:MAG TPA: sulfate reduction electron transfer complex DsrMKJOP subunit DsrM [Vicinamibacterales bacterium]|jgi:nitrate reductase gamma subunit
MTVLLIVLPYAAAALFLGGVAWRVWRWAATPVPFRIPTTSGQQASLTWIAPGRLESPRGWLGVAGRMLLEVLLFRSLFRDTRVRRLQPAGGPVGRLAFIERKALWLGAMAFHWALLVIVLRHLRLFVEPAPVVATVLASVDGFLEVGSPVWYVSDVVVLGALTYLLVRRLWNPLLRYLSLPIDYVVLLLLLASAGTGVVMRYVVRPDLAAIEQFTLSLAALRPTAPAAPGTWFVLHLLSVSLCVGMFPFTKLMHAAGVWLSPTRNQANDSRRRRHVNPWNAPVKVHTYQEWEDEFREKMRTAGLPLERDPDACP